MSFKTQLRERLQEALGTAYAVERELGGGGMARVFVAEETALGRKVVVKVLPPEMSGALSAERFRREVQLAAQLHHPHIVPLLTSGEHGRLLYYTMPFVEGESLRARIDRAGGLPVAEAVRDLKPDNILIEDEHAHVVDFGIAKAVAASADSVRAFTSAGVALGTPAYMSPEQAAADPTVDHRADLYALGVVAYEALAGRHPFAGRAPQAMLAAHVAEVPEPLARRRPSVPNALSDLVGRLLEKRPIDRPQSAAEVVRALDAIAPALATGATATSITPVHAAPSEDAPTQRLRMAPRVVRAWVAAALAAAALALGLLLGLWLARR